MTAKRAIGYGAAMLLSILASGQCIAPFVSPLDRTMIFMDGRFKEVDARPTGTIHVLTDGLLYVDHAQRICHFTTEGGSTHVLEQRPADELQVIGDRAAWRMGDTLKLLRSGRGHVIATGIERFRVSDSLVVFIDSVENELAVHWRGQRIALATVERGSERPQWTQGGNTVTFFDHSQRRVSLFNRGRTRILTDSTEVGIAVNGTDIVGYWDDVRDEFMGEGEDGRAVRLSGMKPVNAQAADGVLAFVDGTLKLKAWRGGDVVQLTDSMPAQYWVKDRVVAYLWAGRLMMWCADGPVEVEAYVPERWQVANDRLVYLDINRELKAIDIRGRRARIGSEPRIAHFETYGAAVVYPGPSGGTVVVCNGKRYTF